MICQISLIYLLLLLRDNLNLLNRERYLWWWLLGLRKVLAGVKDVVLAVMLLPLVFGFHIKYYRRGRCKDCRFSTCVHPSFRAIAHIEECELWYSFCANAQYFGVSA